MHTGIQFTGTLGPNASGRWYTFNWPATWHVVWYLMPDTPEPAPEINWSVAVQRADANNVTYWITATNTTANTITFEGRYAVLNA